MRRSRPVLGTLRLGVGALLLCALGASACSRTFEVEQRETPVHVWLTIPDLAARGGSVDALVYVGPYKVVQGMVRFPRGTPTVILPPLFIRPGERVVSAVLDRGRASASEPLVIEGESWIQIVVRGRSVVIDVYEDQPAPWGQ